MMADAKKHDVKHDVKQKEFYLAQYRKKLSEERRSQERWREQAARRVAMTTTAAGAEMWRTSSYDEKIERLTAALQGLTADTPAFLAYYEEQRAMAQHATDMKKQKKEDALHEDEEKKTQLKTYYAAENKETRAVRWQKHQMARDWQYLQRVEESLPPYMRENLSNMPNNKGYIWRGVQYFGARPAQGPSNEWVLFERRGQKQLIHEVRYGHYHRIFEKGDRGKNKKLVHEVPCPVRT